MYLQAILIPFFTLYPGRETQDNYYCGDQTEFWSCFGIYSSFVVLRTFWILLLQVSVFFVSVVYAIIDTYCEYQSSICLTTRKHGRWKNRSIVPSSLLLLSMISLSPSQVSSLTTSRLHMLPCLFATTHHGLHARTTRVKTPFCEWIAFFNDNYALSFNQGEFYRPDLADLVFGESEAQAIDSAIPSRLLSAHGSLMANYWLDEMAKGGSCYNLFSEFCDDGDPSRETRSTSLSSSASRYDRSTSLCRNTWYACR